MVIFNESKIQKRVFFKLFLSFLGVIFTFTAASKLPQVQLSSLRSDLERGF
jgi:hypothetical protein